MPSKRMNDSVDSILEELDRQQAARDLQGRINDRQVDDILRSVGVQSAYAASGSQVGQGAAASGTAVLEEVLASLPPRPAPVQSTAAPKAASPAPAPNPPKEPARPAAPAAQPAPVETAGTGTSTDTTRTGIIKSFLQKMAPGAEADAGALNEGKQNFQRFFATTVAVLPDEKGRVRAPAQKRRGLFGLGRVEDTDEEFVPINVSLNAHHEQEEPADAPSGPDTAPEEETEEEFLEPEPARPPKRGFFARLFGGRRAAEEDDYEETDAPEEEFEEQEADETGDWTEEELPLAEEPDLPLPGGVTLEETEPDLPEAQAREEPPVRPAAPEPSLQLPRGGLRSKYTAGRGAGLESVIPPAVPLVPDLEQGTDTAAEPDFLAGLLPGDSAVALVQRELGSRMAPAKPAKPTGGSTVYRRKRQTVEFVPRRPEPAEERPELPQPDELPPLRPASGPVGEPLMTSRTDLAVPAQPQEAAAPAQSLPAPEPPESTGFTVQMDVSAALDDTQSFVAAFDEARSRHRRAAPAPAPVPDPPQPPAELEAPAAPEAAEASTGEVDLVPVEAEATPDTSEFVRGVADSIIEDTAPSSAAAELTAEEEERYRAAAAVLTGSEEAGLPEKQEKPKRTRLKLGGVPDDEQAGNTAAGTTPFVAAPDATPSHSYDKPGDAPAVRRDLDRQALTLSVSTIVAGAAALVLIYLGAAALGDGAFLPPPLTTAASKTPLLVTMLLLLLVACAAAWRTLWWGLRGLFGAPSPDTMPALAAVGCLVQLGVFLALPKLYDPARFTLMAGSAALLLCLNTAGKAMDARTLRAGFALVSAGSEHSVARRLVEASLLQAATAGLAEPRPCVLVSRPTQLFKGFLTGASARRPGDKNQQQFARWVLIAALFSVAVIALYRRDAGKAVSAFAAVLCIGAPLAGTLVSAVPARMMQRSAEWVGAVIPGWHDIRQLGRVNVICVSSRDLFPSGCVQLSGLKPVHKENIDRAIVYAASILMQGDENLRDIFLGMIGDRKLLAKVDELQAFYGRGYVGWIDGERVLVGNRALMEEYGIRLPSLEYEQRHTVNQRRFIYLAVSGKLYCVFQVAYQYDPDTAGTLEALRQNGISLVVDGEDFNCDADLLRSVYGLPAGTVKVLTAEERAALEPATAWLPESSGSMLHLGNFISFVGGLEAAAGAAEGERRASMMLSASVLLSIVIAVVLSFFKDGVTKLPLLAVVLYQAAWAVLALIFPMLQQY